MPQTQTIIDDVVQKLDTLPVAVDDYEAGVLESVMQLRRRGKEPSAKQLAFLARMIERYCRDALWLAAEIRGQLRLL